MSLIDLELLGLSKEELQAMVADRVTGSILNDHHFKESLLKQIETHIDLVVDNFGAKHVLPNVSEFIEKLTLQATNEWGEPKGEPLTFVEYLVQRADHYMREKVDYDGKTREECRGHSWNGRQTRIAHLIDRHLQYRIEEAMRKALVSANKSIVGGIEETVKMKLAEIQESLKVSVKSK